MVAVRGSIKANISRTDEFINDWNTHMRTLDMANKYGCSDTTITTTARRLGLVGRKGGRPSNDFFNPTPLTDGAWQIVRGVSVWVSGTRLAFRVKKG